VDEQAQPLYLAWRDRPVRITTTILATLGVVELHLSATGADAPALAAALDDAQSALVNRFGGDVVNTDGRSLEATVGAMLADRGWTMAAAESCTGGLVTVRLTDVPGASAWVDRAVVSYSNAAKIDLLGVPAALIEAHGAVSEAVAAAMADGLRARAGVDVTVAVTGVAGPGGETAEKPVGTVCLAVSGPSGVRVRTVRLGGDRGAVRAFSASAALDMLRRYLAEGAA
jgi:nicotinamide-nucleotide amidase